MPAVLTGILTSPGSGTIARRDEVCGLRSQQETWPFLGARGFSPDRLALGDDSEGKHNWAGGSQARGSASSLRGSVCVPSWVTLSKPGPFCSSCSHSQTLGVLMRAWGTPLGAPGRPSCCQTNPLGGGGAWAESFIVGRGSGGLSCSTWGL